MIDKIEAIIYILYISVLLFIFINIKSKPIYFIILYIYTFLSTYFIANYCSMLNYIPFKIITVSVYSFLCIFLLYYINKTWKLYKNNTMYILFLFSMPFTYILLIKFTEAFLDCGDATWKWFNLNYIYVIFTLLLLVFLSLL